MSFKLRKILFVLERFKDCIKQIKKIHQPNPYKRIIEFLVNRFDIFQIQFSVQHSFVKWKRKTRVNKLGMKKSLKISFLNTFFS